MAVLWICDSFQQADTDQIEDGGLVQPGKYKRENVPEFLSHV